MKKTVMNLFLSASFVSYGANADTQHRARSFLRDTLKMALIVGVSGYVTSRVRHSLLLRQSEPLDAKSEAAVKKCFDEYGFPCEGVQLRAFRRGSYASLEGTCSLDTMVLRKELLDDPSLLLHEAAHFRQKHVQHIAQKLVLGTVCGLLFTNAVGAFVSPEKRRYVECAGIAATACLVNLGGYLTQKEAEWEADGIALTMMKKNPRALEVFIAEREHNLRLRFGCTHEEARSVTAGKNPALAKEIDKLSLRKDPSHMPRATLLQNAWQALQETRAEKE